MLLWENEMIILNIRMLLLFKLAYVCRWSKIFFFRVCIKEGDVITLLILWFIFDHMFAPKKDNPFCPVFVSTELYPRPSVILYNICRLKHSMNISQYNSIPVLKNGICKWIFYSFYSLFYSAVASQKPIYFSEAEWIDMRSKR